MFDQLVVGVEVTVVAERAEEAAVAELIAVVSHVGRGQPRPRQRRRGGNVGEKARPLHLAGLGGHRKARSTAAPEDLDDRVVGIGVEFGLCRTDRLEVEHVEEVVLVDHLEQLGRRRRPLHGRHADTDNGAYTLGVEAGVVPHDQRAPVVADEDGVVVTGLVEQRVEVAGEMLDAVRLHRGRCARPAVAALIGCNRVIAGSREHRQLMTPRIGALGKAVAEHDRRVGRVARFQHVQVDVVDVDRALTDLWLRGVRHSPILADDANDE